MNGTGVPVFRSWFFMAGPAGNRISLMTYELRGKCMEIIFNFERFVCFKLFLLPCICITLLLIPPV